MERVRLYRIESIIAAVERAAKQQGIEDIWKSRIHSIIPWRWQIMRLAWENRYSCSQIGRIIKCDHTTVIHGLVRWTRSMEQTNSYARKVDERSRAELRGEPLAEPVERINRDHGFGVRMLRKIETIKARQEVERRKRELFERKQREAMENAARIQMMDAEMRKLRKQFGWSVYGLARRFDITPQEAAVRIGERIFE